MRAPPQSREMPRHGIEDAIEWIDPRTSREAAWRAVELQEIFGDRAFGAGADEIEFAPGCEPQGAGVFHM
jgi:hypothetical protein